MALVLMSGPLGEPVSVDETKAHLRVDGGAEDALIASLILTSRLHIEAALGLALMTQSWRLVLDAWPAKGVIEMPLSPVQSIGDIRVRDAAGDTIVVDAAMYAFEAAGRPQRIFATGASLPTPGRRAGGIEIDLIAGYGAAATDVPAPIRQALMLLIAHWYEHRDPFEIGAMQTSVPGAVSRLLQPYRPARL